MKRDVDYMEHADGEAETELDADGRAKVAAVHELGELVRGRLERAADDVPEARFAQMWADIDKKIVPIDAPPSPSWFDRYRGYMITAAISAGAVAALAIVLRQSSAPPAGAAGALAPVVHRPSEIESLDTPGGNGTVFNVADEDGNTTVIWVTPTDPTDNVGSE
ncbi:MAG TPA: hypothetical protein VGL61_15710 [Kofleriaceae bacterium]